MIPAIDLARAEELQQSIAVDRQACRDRLKAIEPTDQALKRIIRAVRKMEEAVGSAPAGLLERIGLRMPGGDPVEIVGDQSEVAGVAEPPPEPAPSPVVATAPASPLAEPIAVPAAKILGILQKARHGSTASVEMDRLYELTGMSASAVAHAVDHLAECKLVRRVKPAQKGHLTVLLKDAAA